MAYTLEITDGGTTYLFQVQPELQRDFSFEYGEKTPPVLKAELETWVLKGAMYTGAEAAVTTDFEALRALLSDALTPVSAVRFKRDGATVFELDSATSHRGGVLVRSLATTGGPGQWVNHWQADLAIVGRRLHADGAGVVNVEKELLYTYDPSGLATVTLRGKVETLPGTSAESKARTQALTSPGADYGLVTQGPNGEPSVEVLDQTTDTRARFESTWRQFGLTLPSGTNDFTYTTETHELSDGGERVTTTLAARGPSLSSLRAAVRGKRPGAGLAEAQEREDKARREFAATYVEERASARTRERTGSSLIVYRRAEYSIEGRSEEDPKVRDVVVTPIPGHEPWFTRAPRGPVTVAERIISRIRGAWTTLEDFKVGSRAEGRVEGLYRQPGQERPPVVFLEREGLTRDADLWRAEATYSFVAVRVDPAEVAALVKEL